MYNVVVDFSEVHELILSLHTYLCKSSHKRIELGTGWVKKVKQQLSPNLQSHLVGQDVWMPLQLLAISQKEKDIVSFLKWLDESSTGELFEALSPWMSTITNDLNEKRKEMVYFLCEWNHQYFKDFSVEIIGRLRKEAEFRKSEIQHFSPMEFGMQLTNGIIFKPVEGLKKILFIPQFHSQPSHLFHYFGETLLCQYSPNITEKSENDDPSMELLLMTKALSDKSRLKILRFLANQPATFIEVYRHMDLAKSTVHDHLISLRAAGLINVEIEGETLGKYTFRRESTAALLTNLESYLLV